MDWGFAHVRCVALTSGGLGPAGVADLPLNDVLKVSHRGGGSVGPQTVVVSHGTLVGTSGEAVHQRYSDKVA